MANWRFVTQVSTPNSVLVSSVLKPSNHGMWVDLDKVDTIMLLPEQQYNGARSRLGWLSGGHWHYIFVAEQIDPTQPSEANNNGSEFISFREKHGLNNPQSERNPHARPEMESGH